MSLLSRIESLARSAADRIAALGVIGILGIGVATVLDVFLRAAFNNPIDGLNEITSPLLALGVAACFPAGFAGRVHITIDLAESLLGRVVIAWLRVFAAALLLLFIALVTWRLALIGERLVERGQYSPMLELPVGYFLLVIVAVLALATLVQAIQLSVIIRQAFAENRIAGTWICAGVLILGAAATVFHVPLSSFILTMLDMSPANLALLCFCLMWVMIFLTVPLGAATGLSGLLGAMIILGASPGLTMFGTQVEDMISNDSLAVLPLFLLMGSFATVAGLSSDIYKLAHAALGHLRGGLAHATILGSAGFGALTGSSLATSATIGKVALPEMASRNYDRSLAAGTVAAGGTLGQLVPPSTVIVVYALLTEESIGTLFIATIVPALLAVLLYMIAVSVTVSFSKSAPPSTTRESWRNIAGSFVRSWQVLLLVGIVIGGIYTGVFTETEAASVGAVGAFLIAVLRGRIGKETVWQVMRETTATIAMVYVLIFGAINFSFLVGISGVPDLFLSAMFAITEQPLLMIAMIAIMYLILGTVMDSFAIMIITVPVFLPLILELGFDPIWWGIVTICLVETGMITPPFGINLFILKSIDEKIRLSEVYKGVIPFVAADIIKVALLILFPIIVLWLPSTR